MKKKYPLYLLQLFLGLLLVSGSSCKKQDDFLASKPNVALAVPTSLADLQSLLKNEGIFNLYDPPLGEMSADDYVVLTTTWNTLSTIERNSYIWSKQIYDAGADVPSWSKPYGRIYYANVVLDALPNIPYNTGQQALHDQIKATALFFRSYALYTLLEIFSKPYDTATASTDPGVPLRLTSDLNVKSTRASVQQCYDQIISDLKVAIPLLPSQITSLTQPSQVSANALLARIYLAIEDYPSAFKFADASLSLYNTLVDYNTLTAPTTIGISATFITEDIFHITLDNYGVFATRRNCYVDPSLYALYSDNDLRKTKFFTILDNLPQYPRIVGSYDIFSNRFSGIATDEVYLIRAESFARAGNTSAAMNDLNTLLKTRWKTGTFVNYTAVSPEDALEQILVERRKELILRGLRWADLRRLNKDKRFAITLNHVINGVNYSLPANDPRYALPIPDNEIQLSGISQNPR